MSGASEITGDLRPTDHEYALLSKHVYNTGTAKAISGSEYITEYRKWQVIMTRNCGSGYFGAVYRCDLTKQFVIASRGTSGLTDLYEDFKGVFLNKYSGQKEDAFLLVDLVVHQIRVHKPDYKISFTGHSLGGFLAELCVYYATNSLSFPGVNAVTFESPGSKQSMISLQIPHDCIHLGTKEPLAPNEYRKLDIITYLCYPNLVNSCNSHVGSVYAINVDLTGGVLASLPGIRLLHGHKMNGIVKWLRKACLERNPNYKRFYMADWPKGYNQLKIFFKHAMLKDGMFTVDPDLIKSEIPPPPIPSSVFKLCGNHEEEKKAEEEEDTISISSSTSSCSSTSKRTPTGSSTPLTSDHSQCRQYEKWVKEQKRKIRLRYYGNFKVLESLSSFQTLGLHHFSEEMQIFLKYFYEKLQFVYSNEDGNEERVKLVLNETWKGFDIPKELRENLLSYQVRINAMDLEEVVCSNGENVHDFRQSLSCWLKKTGFDVEDLINEGLIEELTTLRFMRKYDFPPFPMKNSTTT